MNAGVNKDDPRWGRRFGVRLWAINRFLRWTGFRLYIERRNTSIVSEQWIVGLVFWGWDFIKEGEPTQWQRTLIRAFKRGSCKR